MITPYLNHLYTTVNQKTYSAITENEFLENHFSGTKIITTDAGQNRIWTGCYLYGESTYIEFFSEGSLNNLHNLGLGGTGIAFSVDTLSEIKKLHLLFKNTFSEKIIFQTIPRKMENQEIPWFERLLVDYDSSSNRPDLSTWIMTYYPTYLHFRDKLNTIPDAVSRKAYNKINYQHKLMKNMTSIDFSMNKLEYNRFSAFIKTINYQDNEIHFNLHLAKSNHVKINKITFLLNKSSPKQTFHIGDSVLEINKNSGTWEFY